MTPGGGGAGGVTPPLFRGGKLSLYSKEIELSDPILMYDRSEEPFFCPFLGQKQVKTAKNGPK